MTPEDATAIRHELRELREGIASLERHAGDTGTRLGTIEARLFDLEIWRARLQGAAATSRVVWLLAGGAVTGIIMEIVRNT